MDILNCCPKKPSMSLDYIINWIENFQKQEWGPIIEPIVDDYIEHYDWAHLPSIQSLNADIESLQRSVSGIARNLDTFETDVYSRLDNKIEKPSTCTEGNIALWTSGKGLSDSGKGISTTVADGDNNLVTSGAVYSALQNSVPTFNVFVVNYTSNTSTTITINKSIQVAQYNTFVDFISDMSALTVSIFLNCYGGSYRCLATLVIGEELRDEITGNSYWSCDIIIGNKVFSCNVADDDTTNATFSLQQV